MRGHQIPLNLIMTEAGDKETGHKTTTNLEHGVAMIPSVAPGKTL